jgi:4-carboxymuconolactone decarboxylase
MGMDDGRGPEIYREVIGDLGPIEQLRDVLPDIDRYVVDFFYGEIYARPALDLKAREAVSVASLAALGTAGPQLRAHINGALNVGWRREEIVEMLLQVALHAGFPATLNGLAAAREVFAARDTAGAAPRESAPSVAPGG